MVAMTRKRPGLLNLSLCSNGAPGAIRTPDPLVRSQVLYPTELRAPKKIYHANDHLTALHLDKLIVQNCYGIKNDGLSVDHVGSMQYRVITLNRILCEKTHIIG